ncbi:MAG: histidine triad nucleotide-binding protein [Pelovirga sp.]
MTSDCLFCKIAAGEIPATIRYQDETLIVVEDINPQAPTHLLLVPRKHIPTTLDLTEEDNALVGHIYQVAGKIAREQGFADSGFRIINNCNQDGGQTVWHLHFHLLGQRQLSWPPG